MKWQGLANLFQTRKLTLETDGEGEMAIGVGGVCVGGGGACVHLCM